MRPLVTTAISLPDDLSTGPWVICRRGIHFADLGGAFRAGPYDAAPTRAAVQADPPSATVAPWRPRLST
jgi:hypothetical protein